MPPLTPATAVAGMLGLLWELLLAGFDRRPKADVTSTEDSTSTRIIETPSWSQVAADVGLWCAIGAGLLGASLPWVLAPLVLELPQLAHVWRRRPHDPAHLR